jgi:hypothetical protein
MRSHESRTKISLLLIRDRQLTPIAVVIRNANLSSGKLLHGLFHPLLSTPVIPKHSNAKRMVPLHQKLFNDSGTVSSPAVPPAVDVNASDACRPQVVLPLTVYFSGLF